MIQDRLPWRLRARPSATLHEIQVRPTNERQSELVLMMLPKAEAAVKGKLGLVKVQIEKDPYQGMPSGMPECGGDDRL